MEHFNLSSDWKIGITDTGKRVFSPIIADNRDYNPKTDLVLHGKISTTKDSSQKFIRYKYDDIPFNKRTSGFKMQGCFDESSKLLESFPKGKFSVLFFNNNAVKIKASKDKTPKALLTISFPQNYEIFKTNNVLIKFCDGGKIHFAMLMDEGDELNVVNVFEKNEKEESEYVKRIYTYKYNRGHLELHPIII